MSEESYRLLAEHLDRLPGGFAPAENGEEFEVLRLLFTPDEAALAVHLTLDREPVVTIASRAGLPEEEAGRMLAGMSGKGLIFSATGPDGGLLYQASPFIVGIWEFQVDRLTPELVETVNRYWKGIRRRKPVRTIRQMRTVPIGESITPELEALPYEQVRRLVEGSDRFAVAKCICRLEEWMSGGGCDRLEEACLILGDWADYYVREGKGRSITREEVLEILRKADEQGLVLQPSNSRDAAFICCCCDCCCGVLRRLKYHPRPADAVMSRFAAAFDPEACISCGLCIGRCPMDVFSRVDDAIGFDAVRCIGCGLCVTACPAGALELVLKPEFPRHEVPHTFDDTQRRIASDRVNASDGP